MCVFSSGVRVCVRSVHPVRCTALCHAVLYHAECAELCYAVLCYRCIAAGTIRPLVLHSWLTLPAHSHNYMR